MIKATIKTGEQGKLELEGAAYCDKGGYDTQWQLRLSSRAKSPNQFTSSASTVGVYSKWTRLLTMPIWAGCFRRTMRHFARRAADGASPKELRKDKGNGD